MHELERKYTGEEQNLPSEKSHPVNDPFEENSNLAKKQKSVLNPIKYNNNKHTMIDK